MSNGEYDNETPEDRETFEALDRLFMDKPRKVVGRVYTPDEVAAIRQAAFREAAEIARESVKSEMAASDPNIKFGWRNASLYISMAIEALARSGQK